MANETYPKLPLATWWQLREQFQRTMPTSVSKSYLATVLQVSERTAANSVPELRRLNLIDEEGKPSDLANRWRFDQDYETVCKTIRESIYPAELLDAVPTPSSSQERVVEWFQRRLGVGAAAAKRMAVTFTFLSEPDLTESSSSARAPKPKNQESDKKSAKKNKSEKSKSQGSKSSTPPATEAPSGSETLHLNAPNKPKGPSLHIDLQIHISPEASAEQIDKIFESMKKHLYPPSST